MSLYEQRMEGSKRKWDNSLWHQGDNPIMAKGLRYAALRGLTVGGDFGSWNWYSEDHACSSRELYVDACLPNKVFSLLSKGKWVEGSRAYSDALTAYEDLGSAITKLEEEECLQTKS